jgi:hypothetical protein
MYIYIYIYIYGKIIEIFSQRDRLRVYNTVRAKANASGIRRFRSPESEIRKRRNLAISYKLFLLLYTEGHVAQLAIEKQRVSDFGTLSPILNVDSTGCKYERSAFGSAYKNVFTNAVGIIISWAYKIYALNV